MAVICVLAAFLFVAAGAMQVVMVHPFQTACYFGAAACCVFGAVMWAN